MGGKAWVLGDGRSLKFTSEGREVFLLRVMGYVFLCVCLCVFESG